MSRFPWRTNLLLLLILACAWIGRRGKPDIGGLLQSELETRRAEGGPHTDKGNEAVTERGRQEQADETAAKRWKQQSISDDRRAFQLRRRANQDFDKAQELLHDAAVLRHELARATLTEVQIKDNLNEDDEEIAKDKRRLKSENVLQTQYADELKGLDTKEKDVNSKLETLQAAVKKEKVDERHQAQQKNSVASLLSKATNFAKMAEHGLKTSQELRLKSETDVGTGEDDSTAAHEFEDSAALQRHSKSWTHKALDFRSKARLAQEFVVILRHMISEDDKTIRNDKKALERASAAKNRSLARADELKKRIRRHDVSKIEADQEANNGRRERDTEALHAEERVADKESKEAQKENARAMHLIHESHRLQAKAAADLDSSTRDIQNEEESA